MRKYAYILGVYLQGIILGVLLFVALGVLFATAGDSDMILFRYQGF
jgi:hypothetical protein